MKLKGHKLCPDCGQPLLKKGQKRKNIDDYRHADGCPSDDAEWSYRMLCLVRELDFALEAVRLPKNVETIVMALRQLMNERRQDEIKRN